VETGSPYAGVAKNRWVKVTESLVGVYPLCRKDIVSVVLESWEAIFHSKIGRRGFQIGKEIFPKPQILGFLLHELIPLEVAARFPKEWRGDISSDEKDLVFIPDPRFSVEIKTSSHKTQIFGNRSYAQKPSESKKKKSGYYLAVNFGKCDAATPKPVIHRIRFGWLDHTDWVGQKAATGQQAHLKADAEAKKLLLLYAGGCEV